MRKLKLNCVLVRDILRIFYISNFAGAQFRPEIIARNIGPTQLALAIAYLDVSFFTFSGHV